MGIYIPRESLLIRNGSHRKQHVQHFFYCCVHSLQRERCLATAGRIHIDTQIDGYAVEMESVAMIYILRCIQTGSGFEMLRGWAWGILRHRQDGNSTSLL
jgi:hypothetical protein